MDLYQIALGIAIMKYVLAKLKTKQFYNGSIFSTIPDLDVVVGLFRSCKCSPH
jgi:hypothetical protein